MTTVRSLAVPGDYVEEFTRFTSNGASSAPQWLEQMRQTAIERFAERGFPTMREEAWRFTDFKPIRRHNFRLAGAGQAAPEDVAANEIDSSIPLIVMVNGKFSRDLTRVPETEGVTLTGLGEALADSESFVRPHLTQYAADKDNPFAVLNGAFVDDGAFVHVKTNVHAGPIHVLHLFSVGQEPEVAHPRTLVVVEEGGSASVVESYATLGAGVSWTNSVTELVLGQNADLKVYRLQDESVDAFHTASTWSWQDRDSRLSNFIFTFGAAMTRHDVVAVLDGEGAESTLNGLSVLGGHQHVDYHTALDHAKPHCNSWEYFNGVFDDQSRGVFTGRIMVRPGAQKTDAKQTNNNLLLSDKARADSQPQLEIYADDVKCTHGATLGPIDEAHLFYMQSRGLEREHARLLLTYGFASEILNGVELDQLRARLDHLVRDRLRTIGKG